MENVSVQLIPVDCVIEISNNNFGERDIHSNLTIVMAAPSDSQPGTIYICIATNAAGQDTAIAELTIHGEYLPSFDWLSGAFTNHC